MAIDTETKRRSVQGYGGPIIYPRPDGTVGAADREHVAGLYAGIAAGAPPAPIVAPRPPYQRERYNRRPVPRDASPAAFNAYLTAELSNIQRGIPHAPTMDLRDFLRGVTNPAEVSRAFAGAFREAPAGAALLVPSGVTYYLAEAMRPARPISLLVAGATLVAAASMTDMLALTDCDEVSVYGGTFDLNSLALNGISFYSVAASPADCLVQGVRFKNAPDDNTLNYAPVRTLAIGGASSPYRCQNVTVANCIIDETNRTNGIMFTYADGCTSLGNMIYGVENEGITHVGCTDGVVLGNRIKNTRFQGINIGSASRHVTVAVNVLEACGEVQDASISSESCNAFVVIAHNVIIDCATPGISIGSQEPGGYPNDTTRAATVQGNIIQIRDGIDTMAGILVQGITSNLGNAVDVLDNAIDGANIGVDYRYCHFGAVRGNTVTRLVGSDSAPVQLVFCEYVACESNTCDTVTAGHAYRAITQIGVPANQPTFISFRHNTVATSGSGASKALCYFEGTGTVTCEGNTTGGSSSYIKCNAAASLLYGANVGTVTVADVEGTPVYLSRGFVRASSIRTDTSSATIPNNTATTIVSPTDVGLYQLHVYFPASASVFHAWAVVSVNVGGVQLLRTDSASANFTLSLSGSNIQLTQVSGASQAIAWTWLRIA